MIFVVALPDAIRYIRDCADLQGDSRRVRAAKRRRRASRRRPPIGGSRPQGAALITRPCSTVSLYCTRLESTLPCIAAFDLYTRDDYHHARLTSAYSAYASDAHTECVPRPSRPRTLHRRAGCKPTTMTTGNGMPRLACSLAYPPLRRSTAARTKEERCEMLRTGPRQRSAPELFLYFPFKVSTRDFRAGTSNRRVDRRRDKRRSQRRTRWFAWNRSVGIERGRSEHRAQSPR